MRSGILARKFGMSRFFDEQGHHIPVTLLGLEDCVVVSQKVCDRDGYDALQVGIDSVPLAKLSKPLRGFFGKNEALEVGYRKLVEFRVSAENFLDPGHVFSADYFPVGAYVDVTATSKGKGFQGAMKRHNFGGLRASHGVSVSHRSHGSIGACQDPGKVFKGKKMAGHLGDERVTVKNLTLVRLDKEQKLLFIAGGVPGAKNSHIKVNY